MAARRRSAPLGRDQETDILEQARLAGEQHIDTTYHPPEAGPEPIELHIEDAQDLSGQNALPFPIRQAIDEGLLLLETDERGHRRVVNITDETVHTNGYAPPIAPGAVVYLSVRERVRQANEAEQARRRAVYDAENRLPPNIRHLYQTRLLSLRVLATGAIELRNITGETLYSGGYAPIPPGGTLTFGRLHQEDQLFESLLDDIAEETRLRAGYPTIWDHVLE